MIVDGCLLLSSRTWRNRDGTPTAAWRSLPTDMTLRSWQSSTRITDDNEEEQLRLGLGQVLWYRHRLQRMGHPKVVAVLVPERPPRDPSWADLCHDLQVILLHGSNLDQAVRLS
jgi:hypothetical protein